MMQDSYKELINDCLEIELIDNEVNWVHFYKQINDFCHVKNSDATFENWKDEKILIKDVSAKHGTIQEYGTYLRNLATSVVRRRKELDITDRDLQDLKSTRDKLIITQKALSNLIDDWGRDHEYLGGNYIRYHDNSVQSADNYKFKFRVYNLRNILVYSCIVKNENEQKDYSADRLFATNFTTNGGREVFITCDFLSLLETIFVFRLNAHNSIIEQLEPISSPKEKENKESLSHREIALLYYYDELLLIDGNANEIAKQHGQGSGVKLMTMYRGIKNSETERRNNKNSKKCLERIIPILTTPNGILKAKQDLENAKK
jgi:hypothetical protein